MNERKDIEQFESFLSEKHKEENKSLEEYKEYLRVKDLGRQYKEKEPKFKPISNWSSYVALFYDDNGVFIGKKTLKYKDKVFYYKDRAFNFVPEEGSFFNINKLFRKIKYYQYNINEPMPLKIKRMNEPVIDGEVYKRVLESDLIKKLAPKKNNLLEMIGGWKGILLILIAIAVIVYLTSGGSLTK